MTQSRLPPSQQQDLNSGIASSSRTSSQYDIVARTTSTRCSWSCTRFYSMTTCKLRGQSKRVTSPSTAARIEELSSDTRVGRRTWGPTPKTRRGKEKDHGPHRDKARRDHQTCERQCQIQCGYFPCLFAQWKVLRAAKPLPQLGTHVSPHASAIDTTGQQDHICLHEKVRPNRFNFA